MKICYPCTTQHKIFQIIRLPKETDRESFEENYVQPFQKKNQRNDERNIKKVFGKKRGWERRPERDGVKKTEIKKGRREENRESEELKEN